MFDENISWLRDAGIIDKMFKDERRSADVHSTSNVSENQPLNIMRYMLKQICIIKLFDNYFLFLKAFTSFCAVVMWHTCFSACVLPRSSKRNLRFKP